MSISHLNIDFSMNTITLPEIVRRPPLARAQIHQYTKRRNDKLKGEEGIKVEH